MLVFAERSEGGCERSEPRLRTIARTRKKKALESL